MNFTIGADPEVFIHHQDKGIVSMAGQFKGTKEAPVQISKNVSLLVDNAALEYNVTPSKTASAFVETTKEALKTIEKILHQTDPKLSISRQVTNSFPKEAMVHPDNWVFGCEPDYNAWTGEIQVSPSHSDKFFRCVGGHIHVGLPYPVQATTIIDCVKAVEATVGVYLASFDTEEDIERRKFYGRAGSFRFKPYGFEYRAPSNHWIFHKHQQEAIVTLTYKAISNTLQNNRLMKIRINSSERMIREYIDTLNWNTGSITTAEWLQSLC